MSNDLVECYECGKEVEYSDAYSTMEQDTGYHWYYCSDCYGVDLGDYDHQAEASWEKEQQMLWECYADYLPYTEK